MATSPGNRVAAKDNLRILHVLEATLGGTLRYLSDVICASDADRYTLAVAYATKRADPGLNETLEQACAAGWQTFHVEMLRAVSPKEDLASIFAMRKVFRDFRPDIVHCHSSKAGAIGRLSGVAMTHSHKVVYSPHAIAASLGEKYLYIERSLRSLTTRFASVSESEEKELVELGVCSKDKVDIVYPTVSGDRFSPRSRRDARTLLGLPQDAKILLGIGRLVKQKDPLFFLEVVRELRLQCPNIHAIWLGNGELRLAVEAAIASLGLAGVVTMAGWQTDVRPYIAACDVLLSTSRYESFGYMVAEALAMECPVVASNVTGTRDIVSGELVEWMYELDNAREAAALISILLNDSERAAAVGRLGRQQVMQRFNREVMRDSLNSMYQKAFSG